MEHLTAPLQSYVGRYEPGAATWVATVSWLGYTFGKHLHQLPSDTQERERRARDCGARGGGDVVVEIREEEHTGRAE